MGTTDARVVEELWTSRRRPVDARPQPVHDAVDNVVLVHTEKFLWRSGMRCPYCGIDDDRVVDSRASEEGTAIRRRRECHACAQRFSTYERAEQLVLSVRKRSGVVEPFDRAKIIAGMSKATKNLPVEDAAVRRAVTRVEARIRALGKRQVASTLIGAEVLAALRDLDPVAYVRFASVHKGFTSPEDFARELAALDIVRDSDSP